jgi:uncharacterized membrane protein
MRKTIIRTLLAMFMTVAGILHFTNPEFFVRIVPSIFPDPLLITWISGACELLLGPALIFRRTRYVAGLALMLFYVAVFPANLNMALHPAETGGGDLPAWALWLRLPLQGVLIALAWWVSRPDQEP